MEGDRFWNRDTELDRLIEDLDDGNSILLVAQRRIGKTSLMREAARRIQERYICLQVDLEQAQSAADAIAELSAATQLHRSLWEKTKNLFASAIAPLMNRIDSVGVNEVKIAFRAGLVQEDWQEKGDRLLEILAASEKPVVIFFDEVPILVNRLLKGGDYRITPEGRQRVDAFMSWLRGNSIRHQGELRLVVTGSIGLEPILAQAGLSATVNNLKPFLLHPWRQETAIACLEALANQYNLVYKPRAKARVVERLGVCIPYHVQMYFDYLLFACRQQEVQEVSVEMVDRVYESNILSARGSADLSHLGNRLEMVLGREFYRLAIALRALA